MSRGGRIRCPPRGSGTFLIAPLHLPCRETSADRQSANGAPCSNTPIVRLESVPPARDCMSMKFLNNPMTWIEACQKRDMRRQLATSSGDCSLLGFVVGCSGILAEYQDPVMGDQDQVLAAVAVHVADDLVARLAHVADPAKDLALEHLEGDGVEEIFFSRVGRDLQHLFGDVGEDDVGDAVGVQVAS